MILEQARGIVYNTIDKRTGRELDHREIYDRYIDYLGGLDKVKPYIPYDIEYLVPKYKKDHLLNNTWTGDWSIAAGFFPDGRHNLHPTFNGLWYLYGQHGITQVSCATGVCILKEAARMLIERGET